MNIRSSKLPCTLVLALCIPALSQAAELSNFGQNTLQTATGGAVQSACGGMAAILSQGGSLSTQSSKLFDRCGELVQSANELADDYTSTAKSLSLSADQLALALQNVAPEETEIMGGSMTDTSQDQLSSLQSRLQFLRTGTSTKQFAAINVNGSMGGAAGDSNFSRLGFFINGLRGQGDKDAINRSNGVENGFDFEAYSLTTGIDYRFTDNFIAGIALGYSESDGDFEQNFGNNETEGLTYTAYGSYYLDNLYVEASAAYGDYDYDAQRNINYANNSVNNPSMGQPITQQLTSTTSGDSLSWSLGAGYNINSDNQNYVFSANLQSLDADIDGYTETGSELAMTLGNQKLKSLQSVLSAQANFVFNQSYGVLIPFVGVAWHHEFDDDRRDINAFYTFDPNKINLTFTTEPGDSDYATLSLGSSLILPEGKQLFFNYDTALGLEKVSSHVFTLGLRLEL